MVSFRDDALTPSYWCPLCGIALYPDAFGSNQFALRGLGHTPTNPEAAPWQKKRRPWSTEVRAIVCQNVDLGDVRLTRPGVMGRYSAIYVALDDALSYLETELVRPLHLSSPPYRSGAVVFGVHDACWVFLRGRLGDSYSENDVLISLFYLLYGANRTREKFDLGIDYGALPKPREEANAADPLLIPSLDEIEAAAAPETFGTLSREDRPLESGASPLLQLPTEVVYEILSYTSIRNLSPVRLSCRALLAACHSLPQTYWRARFLPGGEEDSLCPEFDAVTDWHLLYRGVRSLLRTGHAGLANRRRIWRVIEPIARMVELSCELPNAPHGLEALPLQPQDQAPRPQEFQLQQSAIAGMPRFAAAARPVYSNLAGTNFHILFHRVIAPFGDELELRKGRIGITTLVIGARRYISSIKYESCEGSGERNDQSVGYHTGADEWMDVSKGSALLALEVAVRPEGLVGIRFILQTREHTAWLGQSSGEGISRGRTSVPTGKGRYGLLLGFDRFKIVALGICLLTECKPTGAAHREQEHTWDDRLDVERYMWTPHPPSYEGISIHALHPFRSGSRSSGLHGPLCNADFGGPSGSLLSLLTRIVFRLAWATAPIGLEFYYSDGLTRSFGDCEETNACELSFLIDGAAGERIDNVSLVVRRRGALYGIQLQTNLGRRASFATPEATELCDIFLIPPVPDGEVITGFVLSRKEGPTPSGYARLGLQSQRPHPQHQQQAKRTNPPQITPQEAAQRTFPHQPRTTTNGVSDHPYHTYAPLSNVRRITASVGAHGRHCSRSANEISGLMLEYYDDTGPVIIGQWYVPHTSVELAHGEMIREITVWEKSVAPSAATSFRSIRKIAAVRMHTSLDREVDFRANADGNDDDGNTTLTQDGLEPRQVHKMHETASLLELKTLAWELNRHIDTLRATCDSCPTELTCRYQPGGAHVHK
ncbi:hypothetical protein BJX64DRAFT_200343 [Aspergillus heterothallicus]